jgi:putative acetyltransferase
MNEKINLREATELDAKNIAVLFRATFRHNLPYLPELHTAEEDLKYFGNVIDKQTVVVSEVDNKVVGFCSYNNNWLNNLYIIPEYQGHGIGTALLDRAKADNTELNLWVFQKNTNAINFYKRNGFELLLTTDGSANEEQEPDAHYVWHKTTTNQV